MALAALYPERVRNLVVADTQIRALQPPVRLSEWAHWAGGRRNWKARAWRSADCGIHHRPQTACKSQPSPWQRRQSGTLAYLACGRETWVKAVWNAGSNCWREPALTENFEDESFLVPSTLQTISTPTLLAVWKIVALPADGASSFGLSSQRALIVIPGAGTFLSRSSSPGSLPASSTLSCSGRRRGVAPLAHGGGGGALPVIASRISEPKCDQDTSALSSAAVAVSARRSPARSRHAEAMFLSSGATASASTRRFEGFESPRRRDNTSDACSMLRFLTTWRRWRRYVRRRMVVPIFWFSPPSSQATRKLPDYRRKCWTCRWLPGAKPSM